MPKECDPYQQTYSLLSHLVEPTAEEKDQLKAQRGLVFLPMSALSCADVIATNKPHFWENELEFASSEPALRHFIPRKAVEIGIVETELALPDSFNTTRAAALEMIEDFSQELAKDFPGFRAIMLPATAYAGVDVHYSKLNPDKGLFKNYYTWCLDNVHQDNISTSTAVFAGRYLPKLPFFISSLDPNYGYSRIGAVPAIVKVGRK